MYLTDDIQTSTKSITKKFFGTMPDGTSVEIYTLRNARGMEARITTFGGTVVSLSAPDRNGKFEDVVLGYDNLEGYLKSNNYLGCLIGRFGNRIADGRFTLNGRTYLLNANEFPHTLHGGSKGFDKVVWDVTAAVVTAGGPVLELTYLSRDGEEGFPGNLKVNTRYMLTPGNELRLEMTATTDADTVVNLTHHSYFNLRGHGDILGHLMQIRAESFIPIDSALIPTGRVLPVKDTPFDFRKPTAIGARLNTGDEQVKFAKGYDHSWVFGRSGGGLMLQANIYEPVTGRILEVLSTEPGMQFYSGNSLNGAMVGKRGCKYQHHDGFCMEPQHFPNSPNHPEFPNTILKPEQLYRNTIIYRFSAK